MFNILKTFGQDLSLFAGQVKDMAAGNLPAGTSPACSDMFFSGQYTATRPALVYAYTASEGTGDNLSFDDYPQPNGDPTTIKLYEDGTVWQRNVTTSTSTNIGSVAPGCRFNGISAFQKFFMAIRNLALVSDFPSDVLAGGDIPRYVNTAGQVLRVSSDAPGGGFSVAPITIAPEDVVLVGAFEVGPAVTSIALGGEQTVVVGSTTITYWTTAVVQLASAVTLVAGQIVQLYNIDWSGPQWPNGIAVASVQSDTEFTVNITQTSVNYSTTSGTFGYVPDAGDAQSLTRQNNIVTAFLVGTSPEAPTLIQAGWYVSLVDTEASSTATLPDGSVPFTGNELFQAIYPNTISPAPNGPFDIRRVSWSSGGNINNSAPGTILTIWGGTYPGLLPAGIQPGTVVTLAGFAATFPTNSNSGAGSTGPTWNYDLSGTYIVQTVTEEIIGGNELLPCFTLIAPASLYSRSLDFGSPDGKPVNSGWTYTIAQSSLAESTNIQGDGLGNIHVTLLTAVESLPIGSWLYVYARTPIPADVTAWEITSNGTGEMTVPNSTFTVGQNILLGGFTSVKIPEPTSWNGQTITITAANNVGTALANYTFLWNGTSAMGASTTGTATPTSGIYPSGWVQVTQVLSPTEFVFYATDNTETALAPCEVYDYFGSLNTQQSLTPAAQQNTIGVVSQGAQASSSGIVQGFQVLSVDTTTTPNSITWYQAGFNDSYTGTHQLQVQPQSQIAAGPRNMFPFFINRDGRTTPGAYPILVNLNGGSQFAQVTLPGGPSDTVARGVAWTAAYGADYYVLGAGTEPATGNNGPVIVTGTIVYDNTTASTIMDFSDASLLNGIFAGPGPDAIGEDYGDLTSLIVLPPCLGVIEYNQQLGWYGELNDLPNHSMINMGFQGGYDLSLTIGSTAQPLGWDNTTEVNGITPDQTSILVNHPLTGLGWALQFGGSPTAINFVFYSAATSFTSTATVETSAITGGANWYNASFSTAIPNPVPADLVFYAYASGTDNGLISQPAYQDYYGSPVVLPLRPYSIRFLAYVTGSDLQVSDLEIIDAQQPVLGQQVRMSQVQNPFAYDNENGFVIGLDTSDFISGAFLLRAQLNVLTEGIGELHTVTVTSSLPSEWQAKVFASQCGCSGPDATASGQSIEWWVGRHGLFVFDGSQPKKISQYNQSDFDATNWNAASNSVMAYDSVNRELFVAFPTGEATNPNMTYRFNYRLADAQINVVDPIHVSSYTGKILATDLCLKQCPMSIPINAMKMSKQNTINNVGPAKQMTFAGAGYGNLYIQDFYNYLPVNSSAPTWNLVDADYGTINWLYVTYPFFSHETELQGQIGLYRKIFAFMGIHVVGIGYLKMTPLIDTLSNPWPVLPSWTLSLVDPGHDYNIGLDVKGNRMFMKFTGTPIPGSQGGDGVSTGFWLTHLLVNARPDNVFPVDNGS